ncbi:hydrolase [Capsulimonas corticalis]|uniref:Hydrolase n=1 Tax=Capsulimonas corticalis TaxID=2219043 RepID=A0A402CP59_9BACT|nr:VWA-like domain-containing protein [Capsulimonas corticalis]BDI33072.1 hydrolase [Capsulimonas corticalis]
MPFEPDLERRLSASLLRLRAQAPFFATLALFARILPTNTCRTAATDGRDIFFYPEFLRGLPPAATDGVLLHEVLHAALLHIPRRGGREPLLWNIAADIVVNGIIDALPDFALPSDAVRDRQLEKFSVEEVYDLLMRDGATQYAQGMPDLLEDGPVPGGAALEAYWRLAREQASILAQSAAQGTVPAGLARELGALGPASLDWRSTLWRYLARTPTDFEGFDRRFLGRGLYLETLEAETLKAHIAIDTSGSVSNAQMDQFAAEVSGILSAYPHIQSDLFYADAALHGPYPLSADTPMPPPIGGGGTDFRPFFAAVSQNSSPFADAVCVYLTDGMGVFPSPPPTLPVLWVVTPGGIALSAFPFGEAVRLLSS